MLHLTSRGAFNVIDDLQARGGVCSNKQHKARAECEQPADIQMAEWPHTLPMLRNATVSEEDNHARFCSPAFRNRFHWWNG